MDPQVVILHQALAEGIAKASGYPIKISTGSDAFESTYFLHCGDRTCVASLQFREDVMVCTIYKPTDKEKTHHHDYTNPDSLDPDKIGKAIADCIEQLKLDGTIPQDYGTHPQ